MAEHIPTRPFESLDWYRDATRAGGRERIFEWVRGIGFLTLHVSVYALAIVALFVVNLLRSPDRIWVDRTILIWSLILVIHAGIAGLLWAVGLLNREDDEPIRVVSDAQWRQPASWPTGTTAASSAAESPVMSSDGTAPSSQTDVAGEKTVPEQAPSPADPSGAPPLVSPQSRWSGWESDIPQTIDPHDPDRASWQEAAAAAWRDRRASATGDPGDRAASSTGSRQDGRA